MRTNILELVSTEPNQANEQQLRDQLEQNPADWDSRQQLAHLLYDRGSFDDAANLIWDADEIPSTDLDLAFAARILSKSQPRKAIRLLTAVLEHNRGKAVQNLGIANALLHHGMVLQSARFYGAALEADPTLVNPDLEHFLVWTDDEQTLWGDFKGRRPKLGELPWMARDPMEALKLTSRINLHTTPVRVPNIPQAAGEDLQNRLYVQKPEKGGEITPPPAVTIPADRVDPKHRRFDSTYGAANGESEAPAESPAPEAEAPAPEAPAPEQPATATPRPKLVTGEAPSAPRPKLITGQVNAGSTPPPAPAAEEPPPAPPAEEAPAAPQMRVTGRPGTGERMVNAPELAPDSPARALAEKEARAAEEKARVEAEAKAEADRQALAAASRAQAKEAEKTRAIAERALAAEEANANMPKVPANPRPGSQPATTGPRLITSGPINGGNKPKLMIPGGANGSQQGHGESRLNPAAGVPVPSDANHGEWFYITNGEAVGPVHPEVLKERIEDKTIQPPLKMIWTTGMDNWKAVYECPQLWEEDASQVFGR